jgi:ABC-type Fe3+ transport system permease subunit
MKSLIVRMWSFFMMVWLVVPAMALAAGDNATEIVVVADTRRITGILKYFSNLYNTNILLFAIWAVVLTAAYGCFLGVIMDFLMARTGLDLKSRKIIEH